MPDASCGFADDHRGTAQHPLTLLGPTLIVDIGFDPNYRADIPGSVPITQIQGVHALIDTGATQSCIDSALAATLNLPIIDRQKVGGVGGIHEVNMHLGHIYVPSLDVTVHGSFAGVSLSAGGQPHVALIGRTFLRYVTMHYDGKTGKVTITHNP
jgi:predicted aspartyl protease